MFWQVKYIGPFENPCGPGKPLRLEPPDAPEFAGLLRSGLARLKDADKASLSMESRFDLVYNAAHALCLAALRWHGYRSGNRYIVFQLLPHTLKVYPGSPHGRCATHPEVIHPDLLAFFKA